MNGLLREGDADAGGIKLVVDLIVDVVEHRPIVVVFDPHSDGEVYAAVGQGRYEHGGFGVGLYALVGLDGVENNVFGFVDALAIVDTDGPLDATGVGAGVVDDGGGAILAGVVGGGARSFVFHALLTRHEEREEKRNDG